MKYAIVTMSQTKRQIYIYTFFFLEYRMLNIGTININM